MTPVAQALPSLFVIALPRSLSTHVHEAARAALALAAPAWTSAGEILNAGRWRMRAGEDDGDRYATAEDGVRFDVWLRFLDDVVAARGRAYKDVVQPFVCAHWLARAEGLRVLRIRRPVADVAWSMLDAGWRYPARAADAGRDEIDRLLSGLLRARAALATVAAVELDFDALLETPDALSRALATLYPAPHAARDAVLDAARDPLRTPAHDADFRAHARTVLQRRNTARWRDLAARVEALESAGHAAGGAAGIAMPGG